MHKAGDAWLIFVTRHTKVASDLSLQSGRMGCIWEPPVTLQMSHLPASQCSARRRLLPSSPCLLFAAGCGFWAILSVALGKGSCSECQMRGEGTDSSNTEQKEACASAAGHCHFCTSAADVIGTGV